MKLLLLPLLLMVGRNAYSSEYEEKILKQWKIEVMNDEFQVTFDPEILSCEIARAIGSNQKLAKAKEKTSEKMEELKPLADRISYGQLGIPNISFFVADAMIDPILITKYEKEPNWHAAYISLIEKTVLFHKDGEHYPNFTRDPKIKEKIVEHLVTSTLLPVTDFGVPQKDEKTGDIVSRSCLCNAENEEDELVIRTHSRKMSALATPLFSWLIDQPERSVQPVQLFSKAMEIYKDSISALGVIHWLTGYDAGGYAYNARKKMALANSKLKVPLTSISDKDGANYHFWGFVARQLVLSNHRAQLERVQSFLFERVYQKDTEDRASDVLGAKVAKRVKDHLNGESSCLKKI